MIKRLTITGADDTTSIEQLRVLSGQFPFVEWGILISRKQGGNNRYPSQLWIQELMRQADWKELKLCAHLCGSFVKEFVAGSREPIEELKQFWWMFDRIQLNFHDIPHKLTGVLLQQMELMPDKEFILQYDTTNARNIETILQNSEESKLAVLFDKSGGAGILPDSWPDYINGVHCGYAGGLGPHNLEEEIAKISKKAGTNNTWVDMETHVRTPDNTNLDLGKVETCLKIAEPYIYGHKK